jgi:CubicO group peptidase (beta-lactamase class C family)
MSNIPPVTPAPEACRPKHPFLLKISFIIALVAGLLATPVQATTPTGPVDPVELESFLDGVMADQLESYHIPGATLTVVRGGDLLLAKGYGYADLEQRTAVDPAHTLFRIGSVSKLVTWTAVMQLVEQGRLDLQADVNNYLDFTIPATYPEPITLAHLMTHTSGFEELDMGLFVLSEEEMYPLGNYLKQRLPARIYPTGEVSAYSNYGAALAGYIVEHVTGESFDAYAEQHIFIPLGMNQSTYRQPLPPELAGDLASGYGFHDGRYVRGGFEYIVGYPVGSMSAPATDMAAFMTAHLQEGRYGDTTILQPATVQEMHRRQYTSDPRLHGMAYGFWERNVNGHRILLHNGDTFLFHSALYLLAEENIGLFVSYSGDVGSQAADKLLQEFMDHYYLAPAPAELASPADAAARIAPYSGEYHLARTNDSSMEKVIRILGTAQVSTTPEGDLLLAMGTTEPYREVEPGVFRHQLRDDLLIFQTGSNGSTRLMLDGSAPVTLVKAPWYATSTFTGLLLLLALFFFTASIIGWLVAALRARRRGTRRPLPAQLARALATLFGLLLPAFLIGFLSVMGDVAPAYGVPRVYFGTSPTLNIVMLLPWLLAAAVVGMALFTVTGWLGMGNEGRSYWGLPERLHHTLLTFTALAVMGSLWYWNFLTVPV